MNKKDIHILLVEDDVNMGFLLKDSLEMNGYQVTLCEDGYKGYNTFFNGHFQLCILDVMLPEQDGFSLAEGIRKRNQEIPIIFLTARGHKEDRINGFKLGADDYMTKPFSMEELSLRIEAILKRVYSAEHFLQTSSSLKVGNTTFTPQSQTVSIDSSTKNLTYREAKLLNIFFTNPNQVLERDFILRLVWEDEGIIVGRSLDVFVSRLRKILKDDSSLKIVNVHGVGYKLEVR